MVIGNMAWFINYKVVYCSHLEKMKTNMIGHTLDFKCLHLNQLETEKKILHTFSTQQQGLRIICKSESSFSPVSKYVIIHNAANTFSLTQYTFKISNTVLNGMHKMYACGGFPSVQK